MEERKKREKKEGRKGEEQRKKMLVDFSYTFSSMIIYAICIYLQKTN